MQRELTFYPEIERTRDLLYSEYTSRQRSIHVLLQDNSGPQYRFLLEAFREIVSRYLSMNRIESPMKFLNGLATRLDELSKATQITPDDFKSMGLFVLLRCSDGYYLFTTKAEDAFIYENGEALSLSQVPGSVVERIHFSDATLQEELFPHRFKDGFLLFALDREYFAERDIVLGCGEKDRSTVLEALSDPLWLASDDQRNTLTSKFISRKILVLRFDDRDVASADAQLIRSRVWGAPRMGLAFGLFAAAAVVAVVSWGVMKVGSNQEQSAALERTPLVADVSPEQDVAGDLAGAGSIQDTTQLSVNWRRSFGQAVTSSPAFHDRRVIFGCRDGNVYALDRRTGESLWTTRVAAGVGASPAVDAEHVVVADYSGKVSALTANTGDPLWQHELPTRVVSSPFIGSDRVIVGCYDGFAYCLSMIDGGVVWKRKTAGKIRASISGAGDVFFVASYDGFLYALSAENGEVKWRYSLGGNIVSTPVPYQGAVIAGSPDGSVHSVSVADGARRWFYRTGGAVKSSPLVADGFVYVGSNDRSVYCLNADDGSLVWKYETGDIVLSRPVIQNGVVYVGSYDGYMYCLESKTGKLLDRFQSDGEIYSSAAADESAVYFGNNSGSFICLNHRAGKAL